jgi:hypothetical protein
VATRCHDSGWGGGVGVVVAAGASIVHCSKTK